MVTGYAVPYDGLPHTATGTATGVLGEDLVGPARPVGDDPHRRRQLPADAWTFHDPAGNYADASGTVDSEITPAALTITADDRTKTYGTAASRSPAPSSRSPAAPGRRHGRQRHPRQRGRRCHRPRSRAAPYPITAVGRRRQRPRELHASATSPGELTITAAALTITADDQSKPIGVAFAFAGPSSRRRGLVNGDTVGLGDPDQRRGARGRRAGHVPDLDLGRGRDRPLELHDHLRSGTMTVGNTTPIIGDADVTTDATAAVSGSSP